jgi:two-component system, OmpR family, sensor kinase
MKAPHARRTVKLRTGLVLQLLIVLPCALFLLSWFVVGQTKANLTRQVDDRLKGAIAGRVRDYAPPRQVNQPRLTSPDLPPTATVILDPAGQELAFAGSGVNGKPDPRPQLDGVWIQKHIGVLATVESTNQTMRFRAISSLLPDGNIAVEVAPLRLVDAAVENIIRTLGIGSLLVIVVAGSLLYAFVRRALTPLAAIAQSATVVASGNLSHGVGVPSRYTELNQLSESLTVMMSQIGNAYDAQALALKAEAASNKRLSQFVADASHELQTPVTSIRGWAELYRKGGLQDPLMRDTAIASVEREATRMGRLVDDLLALTRSDEQRLASSLPVNLKSICDDAISTAQAIDSQRGVAFCDDAITTAQAIDSQRGVALQTNADTETATSSFVVTGDVDQLRQVVDNLLANARVHTPANSTIKVALTAAGGHVVMVVSDDGPGMAPDQLPHVFDRFWRAEKRNGRSHGLGLAIVQSIVDAHGGTVTASNQTVGTGAVITVTLPLSPEH